MLIISGTDDVLLHANNFFVVLVAEAVRRASCNVFKEYSDNATLGLLFKLIFGTENKAEGFRIFFQEFIIRTEHRYIQYTYLYIQLITDFKTRRNTLRCFLRVIALNCEN